MWDKKFNLFQMFFGSLVQTKNKGTTNHITKNLVQSKKTNGLYNITYSINIPIIP